jgi:hypothetical protein
VHTAVLTADLDGHLLSEAEGSQERQLQRRSVVIKLKRLRSQSQVRPPHEPSNQLHVVRSALYAGRCMSHCHLYLKQSFQRRLEVLDEEGVPAHD